MRKSAAGDLWRDAVWNCGAHQVWWCNAVRDEGSFSSPHIEHASVVAQVNAAEADTQLQAIADCCRKCSALRFQDRDCSGGTKTASWQLADGADQKARAASVQSEESGVAPGSNATVAKGIDAQFAFRRERDQRPIGEM